MPVIDDDSDLAVVLLHAMSHLARRQKDANWTPLPHQAWVDADNMLERDLADELKRRHKRTPKA